MAARDADGFGDDVIPFCGSEHPAIFDIERRRVDVDGVVADSLDDVLSTKLRFNSVEEARKLLSFYFGEAVRKRVDRMEFECRVAAHVGRSGEVTK